jgi:cytochrome c oxidase cbb3-type subunit 3
MIGKRSRLALALSGLALIVVIAGVAVTVQRARLGARLVSTPAESTAADPTLVRFARQVADPVYARQCARCHGADMKGNQALGAPNLVDDVWLYDQGRVSDIERTILYGVRSGHAKSHNITDMPAVGRLGVLKPYEIYEVVQYVMQISKRPYDKAEALKGQALFKDKGNCFDCHAPDGSGNPDYGSADLTANVWTYGGDTVTLFKSIRDGRHGMMQAYINKLSPTQIRALALDIYVRSHKPQQVAAN